MNSNAPSSGASQPQAARLAVDLLRDDDLLAGPEHVGEVADVLDLGVAVERRHTRQGLAVIGPLGRLELGDAVVFADVPPDLPRRVDLVVDRPVAGLAPQAGCAHPQPGLARAVDLARQERQVLGDPQPVGQLGRHDAIGREIDHAIAGLQPQRLLDDHRPALHRDEFQHIGVRVRVDRLDLADLDHQRAHRILPSPRGDHGTTRRSWLRSPTPKIRESIAGFGNGLVTPGERIILQPTTIPYPRMKSGTIIEGSRPVGVPDH